MSVSNTPKLEDTIRPGQRIGYNPTPETGQLLGIWVRTFDSQRMALSPWIVSGELTRDETAVRAAWEDVMSSMKSGRVMAGVLVRVQGIFTKGDFAHIDTSHFCESIAVDCRSAHMLRGEGAMKKNEVPDGYDLSLAINRDVSLFLDSTDQSKDDAAKDIAHDTATDTLPPVPVDWSEVQGDSTEPSLGDLTDGEHGTKTKKRKASK